MSRKVFFSLFFTSGVLICGNAGFWQIRRKKWKENLIETRSKYLDLAPINISLPLPDIDLNFRPVTVKGKFDHSKEMLLLRKYGELSGYRVVTPFFINENNGFLVNRGWIPLENKSLNTRKESYDEAFITGVIREGETPSKYTPTNSPKIGEWYYIELDLMSEFSGIKNPEAKKFLIQEINWDRQREVYDEEEIPELPIKSVKTELMNWYVMPYTHASYAAFWFGTSAICLIFNIIVLKRF